jgi:copper(I)-binding protein
MKNVITFVLAGILLLSACSAVEDIEVHEAWARPTAQGNTAAAYFSLHNHTQNNDELIGASSAIADMVEIHESKMENDVMTMNMVSSIPLKAGDELTFEPGGLHVMLIGVKQELNVGDEFELVLKFKNHADITVNVKVEQDGGMGNNH